MVDDQDIQGLKEAAVLIVRYQHANKSFLMSRLNIKGDLAKRILEQLHTSGIISEPEPMGSLWKVNIENEEDLNKHVLFIE